MRAIVRCNDVLSAMIREISREIQGGGGGQPFFATAGGKNPAGIDKALSIGETMLKEVLL